MKFFRSLLVKYMILIVTAIFLIQIIFVVTALFLFNNDFVEQKNDKFEPTIIEENWHDDTRNIKEVNGNKVNELFQEWQKVYPQASMFWVNEQGEMLSEWNVENELPKEWDATFTAQFIKERYNGDPFTVIAFLGEGEEHGFVVFEIPRDELNKEVYETYGDALFLIGILIILLFISISFLFFWNIRKRLLLVQEAMEIRDVDGLPVKINVTKQDEIGQLELAFNKMVQELKDSKKREEKEEQLRRELIANLSHDLRTPLTKISVNIYSLSKEVDSTSGKKLIASMEESIRSVDKLIDNLMSYTLLVASKYKYQPEQIDIVRFVKESLASWYPIFEQEDFQVVTELKLFEEKSWYVDPIWMERILDNIFQNVLRHAKSGKYLEVKTESKQEFDAIIIIDHGPGIDYHSGEKGAGIGLSIVDMMMKGLNLTWDLTSSEMGTTIKIKRNK